MNGLVFEFVLCAIIYGFLIGFIFVTRNTNKGDKNGSNDDEEGGIPVNFPPDFDLPPGVCLPDDPILRKVDTPEETFA